MDKLYRANGRARGRAARAIRAGARAGVGVEWVASVKGAAPKGLAVRKREVTKQAKNFVVVLEGLEKVHSLLAKFGPANLNSPERVKKHGVANEVRADRWPPEVWKNAGAHRLLFGHLKGRMENWRQGGVFWPRAPIF